MSDINDVKSTKELVDLVGRIAADGKANADAITRADRYQSEVKATLQKITLEVEKLARERHIADANGSDRDVVREYCPQGIEADQVTRSMAAVTGEAMGYEGRQFAGKPGEGVVRMLGGVDKYGEWQHGLLDDPHPKSAWQLEAQQLANTIGIVRWSSGGKGPAAKAPRSTQRLLRHLRRGPEAISRVFADNAGEGGEFVADIVMPDLIRELRLPVTLAGNFPRIQSITGGTTTNPFVSGGCQPFIVAGPSSGDMDPATLTKSVPTTSSITSTPTTLAVVIGAFRDIEEDSIVEYQPFAQGEVVRGLRDGWEDVIVNSDTAGGDTALAAWAGPNGRWAVLGATNDHRKSQIGLRHRAIDVSAHHDYSAAQTYQDYVLWRTRLASAQASNPRDLMYVLNLENVIKKLLTDASLLTIDKYGSMATMLTGEVASIAGVPVVISEYMTADLNASGVHDNVTKTYTGGLLVNRTRFTTVERRGARVEAEVRPTQHMNYLVASQRMAWRSSDGSGVKNVMYAYKLTP